MRKLVLSALLIATFNCVFAQKLDDVREKIEKGKYDEAKEKIDKVLADPKNQGSADAWLYKAQVYAELSKANAKDTSLAGGAFDAINRYVAIEGSKDESKRFLMSKLQGHRTFFDVYSSQFKAGADAFNTKDYQTAFVGFSRAADMFDVLAKYGMTEVKFDTTSVLYAGVAAESAKMPDQAVRYYQKVAELKIPDTTHMGVYGYLINYYRDKKDMANANKYIDAAENLFPNKDAWMSFRIDLAGQDSLARLNKYEELIGRFPNNMMLINDYAVEMYRYVYFNDKRAGDTAWVNRLKDAYRAAARVNPTAINNYVIMTILSDDLNYYINNVNKLKSSTKPEDVKKRQAFQASLDKTSEEMVQYAMKTADAYAAMPNLKASDKANYKRALNNIVDYYRSKNQADKAAQYEQKIKQLN